MSWGERLLPYLFAAMEACWIDALIIAQAGVGSSATHAFFLPLWVPFVLLLALCWLSNTSISRHVASTGEPPRAVVAFPTPPLVIVLLVSTTLFSLWSGLYAASFPFYNPLWLGNLIGDVFSLGAEAFHIVGIIALVCYFYWRSLRLGQSAHEPGNVFMALRIGVGILLTVIIFQAATSTTSSNEFLLLLLMPLFLLLALLAHALAQISFVRTTYRSGLQGNVFSQERSLLTIILGFGVVLFLLALLIGAIASPAFLADAQSVFTPVSIFYGWLTYALAFVVSIFAIPAIWLFQTLHLKIQFPASKAADTVAFCHKYPNALRCLSPQTTAPQNSNEFFQLAGEILVPLLLLLLVVLIVRLLRQRRPTGRRGVVSADEVHESLWSWSLLLTQIRTFFRALWQRLFARPILVSLSDTVKEEIASEATVQSVREVYRAMLCWAAERGYPRKRDETPYEFRGRLHTRLPLTEPELSRITEAYTATRYGRTVPNAGEVAAVQQTWTQLRDKVTKMRNDTGRKQGE